MPSLPRLPEGLRWRVVLGMVATAVASLLLMGIASLLVARRGLVENQRATALEETRAAMTVVDRQLGATSRGAVARLNAELRRIGDFHIVAELGDEVVRSNPRLGLADVPTELRRPDAQPASARTTTSAGEYMVAATRIEPDLAYYLFFPLDELHRDITTLTEVVGLVALGTAAVMVLGTIAATRRLFRPVDQTAAAARELAAGALGARAPEQQRSFTDLTTAFNRMAEALQETIERLQRLEARERQFVADVSHELRTPMTALNTAADLLEPALQDLEEPRRRAAEMLITEVRRLQKLVEDLMAISVLDADGPGGQRERVPVGRAVRRLLERSGWHGVVSLDIDDEPIAETDPRQLYVILRNLVDNALKHGDAPVSIEVHANGSMIEVDVADAGPGVPPEHRERIFERFHKTDPARTRGRGSGLGLAIARETARLLDGDLELLDSGPGEGARFRLRLPGAPADGACDPGGAGPP